jgi:hypothetical protein
MGNFEETTHRINGEVMVTAGLQSRIKSSNKNVTTPNLSTRFVLHDASGKHLIISEDVVGLTRFAGQPITVRFRVTPNQLIKSQEVLGKNKLLLTFGIISINDLQCAGWSCESINKELSIVEIQLFDGTPNDTQILNG